MVKQIDKVYGQALISKGILPKSQVEEYLLAAESLGKPFDTYLVERHIIDNRRLLEVLSEYLKLEIVDLKTIQIDPSVIQKVPVKFVWYYKFMPVEIKEKTLTIAISNPLDVKIQDEVRVHLGLETKAVLAPLEDIQFAIKKYYGLASDTIDQILTKGAQRRSAVLDLNESKIEDVEEASEDASVKKLVNQIIFEAYKKRATDIHIEPYRDKVRFRYRIDGVLVDANLPPDIKHFLAPIISRIKIMSNLSIVEKRIPQDGSAVVKTQDQTLDLRVSTIPTPWGESMVIRILPSKVMFLTLEQLGLNPEDVKLFRNLIKRPHGIIFVTGPTGSGKTTTLYAALMEVNSMERKIITIEDPVEYEMEGITQIQVNSKVNLDFATGLRSILRHDPDILMVGEVRDKETAEIAIRTALTGHLVFSTLHTNDAANGVTRLVEMGLEPFLVSSSIEALIAQRLVRVICPKCKTIDPDVPKEIRQEIAMSLKEGDPETFTFYKGKGCDFCNNTGFYGRTAIYEILVLNETIRAAILEKARADYIRKIAFQQGMRPMRFDGWRKVIGGITTPTEVLNAVGYDEGISAAGIDSKKSFKLSLPTKEAIDEVIRDRYRVIKKEVLLAENEYDSRIYKRVQEKIPVRYRILHGEEEDPLTITVKGAEHSTVTKDISAGGVMLISGHHVPEGAILELKIQLKEKEAPIECLGRVCRIEENKATHLYNIVAYYLDISSKDRVRIEAFAKEISKGEKKEKKT